MIDWLRGLLRGSPDEYALMRTAPDREVVDRVDEPIGPLDARDRYDLGDGRYCLQEVREGRFERSIWSEEFGDPRAAREIESLRDELQELRGAVESSTSRGEPQSVDELIERERGKLALAALRSEEFVSRHGEQIALSAFGSDESGSIEFEDAVEHPVGAALWELKNDPEKLRDMTGAILDGMTGVEALQEAGAVDDDVQEAEAAGSRRSTMADVQGGPTSIDELGEALEAEVDAVAGELVDDRTDSSDADVDDVEEESAPIAATAGGGGEAVADGGEPDPEEVADAI